MRDLPFISILTAPQAVIPGPENGTFIYVRMMTDNNGEAIWKKVKNPDLWQRFLVVYRRHRVSFHWIKGHAGHPENERCDRLAVAAGSGAVAMGVQLPPDEGYERLSSKDDNENLF